MRQMKKGVALLATAAMLLSMSAPAQALIKRAGEEAASSTAEKSQPAQKTPAKAASGAFTGSTELARYLYSKLASNPASLAVPTSKCGGGGIQKQFATLGDAAEEVCIQNGLIDTVTGMSYSYNNGSTITLKLTYNDKNAGRRKTKASAAAQKADAILASVVTDGMTAAQKAQALYNYVADNTTYDYAALNDFLEKEGGAGYYAKQTAYSSLVEGKSICQGFAKAYKLLCDRAGVPCVVVFGKTSNGIAHAWNRIQIDGVWRTVDTSNRQLRICAQDGIYIADATAAASLTPDTHWLVDSQVKNYI